MNTKLHAVTDADGRPLSFFMTAGQVSDYTGAAALLDDLPKAQWLLGDRGYDADWYRDALQEKGIKPCIPGRKSRIKLWIRVGVGPHPLAVQAPENRKVSDFLGGPDRRRSGPPLI